MTDKSDHARDRSRVAALRAFADRAASALAADERVQIVWLTGSLAAGTGDAQSDVDLRAAVCVADFAAIAAGAWQELLTHIRTTIWQRRWPGPPDEIITSAITHDYTRYDLVIQSADDLRPRTLSAALVLFDRDGLAARMTLTEPAQQDITASISVVVDEFIRLVGMLPIVVGRDDMAMGMEGQMGLHSLLISLLLLENGIDRSATGKRHVSSWLSEEQRAVLASIPALEPTMRSVIEGRLAYARLVLPRARRLMAAHHLTYPDAFETATREHLRETLGVTI